MKMAAQNNTYPKGGVSCSIDNFVVAESFVLRINFSGKKPHLPQAPNPYQQTFPTVQSCTHNNYRELLKI